MRGGLAVLLGQATRPADESWKMAAEKGEGVGCGGAETCVWRGRAREMGKIVLHEGESPPGNGGVYGQ